MGKVNRNRRSRFGGFSPVDDHAEIFKKQVKFNICLALFAAFLILAMTSCASYQMSHQTTTTTMGETVGQQVVVVDHCSVSIASMREVRSGDLTVNKDCEVTGGAGALGTNAEAIGLIKEIIRKVP